LKRAAILLLLVAGCRPELGAPLSAVTSTRIAAVALEPPEAAPGDTVTATALIVSPAGTQMLPVDWSLCVTPKSTTNNDVVDPSCLQPGGTTPVGTTPLPEDVMLPANGCQLFGPETPPSQAGQPPLQPRAPDVTGGYYQPLRAELADGAPAIALARIHCALADASFAVATQYAAEYVNNRNPSLTPLSLSLGGAPLALDAVPANATVTLGAGWTAASVESFVVLDPAAQVLVTQREAMTISWLATAGVIASADSGAAGANATTATTTWATPSTPGLVHLWVVLRDSRGGVDFAAYDVTVTR
jgi:hypothetical protein